MEDPDRKEEPGRIKLRTMLGELLERMEGAEEVAGGIAREHPPYRAMAEAVRKATDIVMMACEAEAYGEREGHD
jgi:hypothetical protein